MRRQPPRRRLRPSFPSSPSRSFPAIRTRPEPFFPSPLPPSRENFVFVSYSTSMIRSLRYIDFVRIAKTERLERKQGERERERERGGEGRSCRGEQVFYQTGCVPISRLVRTYRLVDTLADRRQLIKENSETICSREYPCRFSAVDF